jgi:DNA processing protein
MELFLFLQKLSFSPVRSLIQDKVLALCDQRLSAVEFKDQLVHEFPELGGTFRQISHSLKFAKPVTECHRLIYGDLKFPMAFRNLADPPWTLTVLGDVEALHRQSISIIGSREPGEESIDWLERELGAWPKNGWVFNSGGARGIDQKAHQICLRHQCPTVIFLPSGVDNIYPGSLKSANGVVKSSGSCFVSEFEDDFVMRKYSFSFRNRLIAALGKALLVIEAGEKSGSLMTGRIALEMGRPVFVIPGHPAQGRFRGSLDLLRTGAQWIENAQDLTLFLEG